MRWTVIEHAGRPVASGPSALLAAPGGTIGRSPDNHLVLPDEQRQISRLQATVRFDGEGIAVLRNMSAVLPIGVNGHALRHDEESRVADGDRVSIGSYVLEATSGLRPPAVAAAPAAASGNNSPRDGDATLLLPSAGPHPASPLPPVFAPAPPSAAGASADVFADLFGAGALPIGDPKTAAPPAAAMREPPRDAAPFRAPAPAPAPTPAPALSSPSPFMPAAAGTRSHGNPSLPSAADWDAILANAPRRSDEGALPMADPMAHEPFELPSQARRNPVDPLAELNPGGVDQISDMALKRGVDPLALFAADDHSPSPLADPRPSLLTREQPLGEVHPALELMARPPVVQGYGHSNHAPEVSAQFSPPLPVASSPSPAAAPAPAGATASPAPAFAAEPKPAPAPAPVQAALASSTPPLSDDLFKAFLEGAGVPDLASSQQPLDAEAMRRIGRLLRAFTDGTIELLSSRAMLKREVRAEITMIVDEENNPFKILPNGRAVLMQMFGARMPGFLSPEAAVHDALGDLQSHQLGMVAGMRAALLTLLQRFDPAALGRDTPHDGGLGEKWLPGGREARLWRQLELLHAQTTEAVEDDFQAVFGRAFQQAYDREMERLKEARRA